MSVVPAVSLVDFIAAVYAQFEELAAKHHLWQCLGTVAIFEREDDDPEECRDYFRQVCARYSAAHAELSGRHDAVSQQIDELICRDWRVIDAAANEAAANIRSARAAKAAARDLARLEREKSAAPHVTGKTARKRAAKLARRAA